jgi:hypothetical protein
VRRDWILDSRARFVSGTLTAEEARAEGFDPEHDARGSHILDLFLARRRQGIARAMNAGIRGLLTAADSDSNTRDRRIQLAVEAAIVPYRKTTMSRSALKSFRLGLRNLYGRQTFASDAWEPIEDATPEQLRDEALAELTSGAAGPAARLLALYGGYWLVKNGSLLSTTGGGFGTDTRGPGGLVEAMMATTHGIHQLYQAVVDGRAGREPSVVDAEGLVQRDARGVMTVRDKDVRMTWPKSAGPAPNPAGAPAETPVQQLANAKTAIRDAAESVETLVGSLREITDGSNTPVVVERGLSDAYVVPIVDRLNGVVRVLGHYQMIWEAQNDEDLMDDEDTDPEDE